ncbi:hypothetical protein Fcan01_13396 [Folsomia candida]|uniref:Regulatory protein zeste n=1 Tax=Folsomia candida TaxID=158441 RepID=A0A226E329_FOLCA|nr:hypothetical protein Fcan01_13396 [Folsomia candida]
METILQLSRRMAHNSSSPPSSMDMKYSPTESLKLSNRDNKRIERRKPNWTEAENVFLLDQFGIHREILTCKATDASTNLKKQEIWRLICQNLNTHNTLVRRTPAEVRRKWKNLVTAAKKEVWEMRHQIHLSGGSGSNGRKISELSQRVLQLHSSGGFSSANPNGLYGTLLSAGLIGPPTPVGGGGGSGDKYGSSSKYDDDKSYIPAHFTPIITLSESNNNHISLLGSGNHSGHSGEPPSPLSEDDDDESSDSRNAAEFMSDSGIIYEQEGIDLRVNVSTRQNGGGSSNSVIHHHNGINGRNRHLIIKNSDPGDDDEDDEDDVEVEDMSLIRFASHLGLREKFGKSSPVPINPFITSALLNNNNNNNSINKSNNIVNHNLHDFERSDRDRGEGGYNIRQSIQPRNVTKDVAVVANGPANRKSSESTEEISTRPSNNNIASLNGDLIDATLRLRNHFLSTLKESDHLSSLYKERLELQIEVLKLRKQKLNQELEAKQNRSSSNKGGVANNRVIRHNSRVRAAIAQERRNRNRLNPYFRLKPKNTWMNFAAREKLLEDGIEGVSDVNVPKTVEIVPNGVVNGNASDSSSDQEGGKH